MIEDNEWYKLKIEDVEKKFQYLLERVRKSEEELRHLERRVDNHQTLGDFCPHTGK